MTLKLVNFLKSFKKWSDFSRHSQSDIFLWVTLFSEWHFSLFFKGGIWKKGEGLVSETTQQNCFWRVTLLIYWNCWLSVDVFFEKSVWNLKSFLLTWSLDLMRISKLISTELFHVFVFFTREEWLYEKRQTHRKHWSVPFLSLCVFFGCLWLFF